MLALACGLAGTATLAAVLAAPAALATGNQTGSAFAVSVNAKVLNAMDVELGPLPKAAYPAGNDKSVIKIDLLEKLSSHAKLLNAASDVKDGVLTSAASIADVNLLNLIKAKLITSSCTSDGKTISGGSKLVDLWIDGHQIDVSLPGKIEVTNLITIWIDEKIVTGNTLTVNALRVSVGGLVAGVAKADVILSQSKCSGPGEVIEVPGTTPNTTPATTSGSTSPTTSGSATTSPGGSITPSVTATPSSSSTSGPSVSATSGAPQGGNSPDINNTSGSNLPNTGASGVIPLAIGGFVLVAGGAGVVWYTRRRRAAASQV
jgi:LPXTG-motif cell wall-anchored protein